MRINAGYAITEAMMEQADKDLLRLLMYEVGASGRRIAAKLEAAGPEFADLAEYHRESMRQVGIDP
jgi:hypothetical protein